MKFSIKRHHWLLLAIVVAVCLVALTQVMRQLGKVDSLALISQAEAALNRQDIQTAGSLLDRVLAQDPTNALALLQRGKLWSSIGNFENAIEDWQKVQESEGSELSRKLASEARSLEGILHVNRHRAVEAERALREAWGLQEAASNLPTLELLLRIYVVQMRRAEIREVLRVIETYRPLSLEEMVLRTDAGAPIIAEADATAQLRAFITGDSSDLLSVVALARYLMSSEKFKEAEMVLDAVPKSLAQNSSIIGLKSLCLFKLNRREAALATMAGATSNDESSYWWWMAAGELAESHQQMQSAAECFGLACQTQPNSGYARYRFGLALGAIGEKEASGDQLQVAAVLDRLHQQTEAITRMTNLAPANFVSGLLQIASNLRELNSEAEAAGWARLAMQIDPNNREAQTLSSLSSDEVETTGLTLPASELTAKQHFKAWVASNESTRTPLATPSNLSEEVWPRFEDVHQVAGLDFQYFNGNSGFKYLIEAMGGGVSMLDYDNDGWPDCYFPQGCEFPINLQKFDHLDQLYRNRDGQRFVNATNAARLIENGYSQGTVTADLDNDGFADVVVANFGRNRVFMNQGDGTFRDATTQWGMEDADMSSSLAVADFDLDGNLDLYVVNYVDENRICRSADGKVSTCNPQNFKGVQDRLFRNSGEGQFFDVTDVSGIVAADGKGLGVVVSDLDDDGLPDIYVSNDTTPNFLFKNLGAMRFEEIGLASGTALSDEGKAQAGMGIAVGDFNGDLRSDLFVTNFYLESNNLYINHGAMSFKDEAMQAKLSLLSKRMLGFGTQAEDVDLDGDLDLIVANGHIDDYTARGDPWKMPTQLFRNLGDGSFEDCSSSAGTYFDQLHLGRGIASCDWNRDGQRDFIVVHQDAPCALLENRTHLRRHAVSIRVIGRVSNRDGIGTKMVFETANRMQRRDLNGGGGYYATNERMTTVGIGEGKCDLSISSGPGNRVSMRMRVHAGEISIFTEN